MQTTAIVLAAGAATRFGAHKVLANLGGKPLCMHAIDAFDAHPGISKLLLVGNTGLMPALHELMQTRTPKTHCELITGGGLRAESSWLALQALRDGVLGSPPDAVLIHDAARPLVSYALIDACQAALQEHAAVCPAAVAADTVRQRDGSGTRTLDRSSLFICQTPQGFHYEVIYNAYANEQTPPVEATDDCAVLERQTPEVPIHLLVHSEPNPKVTTPADLDHTEQFLRLQQ